jgi:hypothetical protein
MNDDQDACVPAKSKIAAKPLKTSKHSISKIWFISVGNFYFKKLNYIEFSLKVTLHSMFFDFGKYLKLTEIDQI